MSPTTIEFEVEAPTNFIKGLDGKSAYEYATAGGYEGTEAQFYEDLGKLGSVSQQMEDFDERLTAVEEQGFAGKYLAEVTTMEGLSLPNGTRVMYIGPTTDAYTSGYVYAYYSEDGSWRRVDVQPMPEVPEIPDLDEIRQEVADVKSFFNDRDHLDSTINKWRELEDFLAGVTDQDTLVGKMSGLKDVLEEEIGRKQDQVTGAATSILTDNLAQDRAVVSGGNGKISTSTVTSTELSYLSGVSYPLQAQLNGKQDRLEFDAAPMLGSMRPVTSNGIRIAINEASAKNRFRYATASSVGFNLSNVDTGTFAINDMLTITDLGSGTLRLMSGGTERELPGPFDFDLMFRWTGAEFRPMFPFLGWSEY
jgi:hypothetical protein